MIAGSSFGGVAIIFCSLYLLTNKPHSTFWLGAEFMALYSSNEHFIFRQMPLAFHFTTWEAVNLKSDLCKPSLGLTLVGSQTTPSASWMLAAVITFRRMFLKKRLRR